jgi:hypothetical protein
MDHARIIRATKPLQATGTLDEKGGNRSFVEEQKGTPTTTAKSDPEPNQPNTGTKERYLQARRRRRRRRRRRQEAGEASRRPATGGCRAGTGRAGFWCAGGRWCGFGGTPPPFRAAGLGGVRLDSLALPHWHALGVIWTQKAVSFRASAQRLLPPRNSLCPLVPVVADSPLPGRLVGGHRPRPADYPIPCALRTAECGGACGSVGSRQRRRPDVTVTPARHAELPSHPRVRLRVCVCVCGVGGRPGPCRPHRRTPRWQRSWHGPPASVSSFQSPAAPAGQEEGMIGSALSPGWPVAGFEFKVCLPREAGDGAAAATCKGKETAWHA